MSWIKDIISPETRQWEEFYRNRFQHDKIVRSTHGVNCTGGCSWQIHVKDGIVVWETQQIDYPLLEDSLPPYEPRGCQRGISFSWYLYSPLRIKYPLIRGALIDAFRKEKRAAGGDPLKAWENLQADSSKLNNYQEARGMGGFRRASWDEVLELMAAANIYTAKKYGPDRVIGFSPIPAMSMLSYAAGGRFLQLFGGVCLSFYDWYCDLPTAFPELWGEQTDVCESADWYNSKMIADMGACLNMTRTPDCHFFAESRHNGTKAVVFSPDFSQVCKYADQWVPLHAGSDGAFWMAATHVILKEFHHEKKTPYFLEYSKKYTDSPYLVKLEADGDNFKPGRLLRANELKDFQDMEKGEWKFVNIDEKSGKPVVPKGAMGHRWDSKDGNWNMKFENSADDSAYDPILSFIDKNDQVAQTAFTEWGLDNHVYRGVPARKIKTVEGEVLVTTVYDLIMGQYGVGRGLDGAYPADYGDKDSAYTPAWQEIFTGVDSNTVLQFAREWASTAEITEGKCMIIIGAGINHWYHANLMYRAGAMALMLCGCVGKNGGGLNHYVGQEKLAPMDSWSNMAFAKDWVGAVRLQQAPLWHYINTCQYRYDGQFSKYNTVPDNDHTRMHTADTIFKSVRNGWMPFYPQFKQNTLELTKEAMSKGAKTDDEVKTYVLEKLKSKELEYSIADPEAEENYPRVWYIWRGNAIVGSMKGHEYCLKHYLGTHSNKIAKDSEDHTEEVKWHEFAPEGKMDLVVDLNFRMDSSAVYYDIVLPAASWYEKADMNSTDLHSFIHPLSAAVAPVWESKTDWEIFKALARVTSEAAKKYLSEPQKDIIASPLSHDTADEVTQPNIKDWYNGECEAIPGQTMHKLAIVDRDYTKIYEKYITLGENIKTKGLGAHGNHYFCEGEYQEMINSNHFPVREYEGQLLPSIEEDTDAANAILHLSTLTNGALTVRAYENMEKKTGLDLVDLGKGSEDVKLRYADLQAQPRRYNTSPLWSGLMNNGRAYCAYTYNVDKLVPWRTLTGRQAFYLDHEMYIAYGENLPTYKPSPKPEAYGDLKETLKDGAKAKVLNCLTPHGKWHIHSTYMENHRMLTLSRGIEPCWINEMDARDMGIQDNDWVEVYNDHGVYCTRASVSARIPRGVCIVYHVPERTTGIPKSQVRGNRRGGGHNSFTRVHIKPNYLCGGYGQFSYHFNYWGPIACNRDTHVTIKKMTKVVF